MSNKLYLMKFLKITVGLFFIYFNAKWIYTIVQSQPSGPTPLYDYVPFILMLYGLSLIGVGLNKDKPYPKSAFTKIFCPIVSIYYLVTFIRIIPQIVETNFRTYDLVIFTTFTIPVAIVLIYDLYWIFKNIRHSRDLPPNVIDEIK